MQQEKKLILLEHYLLYVLYDGAREKTHSLITLIFVYYLSWTKRKSSFCYNIIFCMLSMIEQERNLILLEHYLLYVVYDGAREKTHSLITLIFVYYLSWTKRKSSFCYNIIFCMLSMREQQKKTHSAITFFFVCCL